jgi:hypothetical protein
MPVTATPNSLLDPCGRFLPALLYHDLLDRLNGRRDRARSRWGAIGRPDAPGKLLWVAAADSRESVRLGVELVRTLAARRPDLSITLTFEARYPELLAPIESNPRIVWSYAPADYVGSMQSVWRRLLPFGIILAGMTPRQNLVRLCSACHQALLVAPPGFAVGRYERIYPGHRQTFEGRNVAPPADLDVLMLPAACADDTRLSGMLAARTAYLWHGADEAKAKRVFALFRGRLPQSVMLAAGPVVPSLRRYHTETVTLSEWPGQPVPPDKLVLIDSPGAFAGLRPGPIATHFDTPQHTLLWQSMAAGAAVSAACTDWIEAPGARAATAIRDEENALIDAWRTLDGDASTKSDAAKRARDAYEGELVLAQRALADLVGRVAAWQ